MREARFTAGSKESSEGVKGGKRGRARARERARERARASEREYGGGGVSETLLMRVAVEAAWKLTAVALPLPADCLALRSIARNSSIY